MENILPILIADAPNALTEFCGVNLLERLLRTLQRLGFQRAVIFSSTPESVAAELAKASWAREQITTQLASIQGQSLTAPRILEQHQITRFLIIPANIYCDGRLIAALSTRNCSTALVDSNPPPFLAHIIPNPSGPALVTRDLLTRCSDTLPILQELRQKIDTREIDILDAANIDDYIMSMRRHVRPLCFTGRAEDHRVAERVILDAAQKGTLDFPAYVHAPIETAMVSLLCKTRITPNQVTITGFIIGCGATAAFGLGRVGLGIVTALVFGVVDGLDGKLSRVKVETTERGEWEHHLDYLIENSWWTAIAFYLWQSARLPNAFYFLALLIGSHLLDEFVKRKAKIATGRLLDDVAPFDRLFRLIAARRNVYVWLMACGLLLGVFPKMYAFVCGWAAITAAVHLVRSVWICNAPMHRVLGSGA